MGGIIRYIMGKNDEFTAEHQFFNATCIVTLVSTFLGFIVNGFIMPPLAVIFIIGNCIIFYLARIKKKYGFLLFAFFIISVLGFLSYIWFLTEGSKGGILYFYLATVTFILFMTERWVKVLFVVILLLNVSFLFYAERHAIFEIAKYKNDYIRFWDVYVDFIIGTLILSFVISNIRRLYYNEKNNTIALIEEYRIKSESLKNELNDRISILSLKEREIFQMIIEGKTNKEIAGAMNVSLGTIKTHINNMYKKLGTKKRTDVLSMVNEQSMLPE